MAGKEKKSLQNERDAAMRSTERVAEENKVLTSNGNRESFQDDQTKTSDAQHGGPDIDKARRRQPPDAVRSRSKNTH